MTCSLPLKELAVLICLDDLNGILLCGRPAESVAESLADQGSKGIVYPASSTVYIMQQMNAF